MQLTIDYPWYFVLLCVALGAVYASVLYLHNKRSVLSPTVAKILFLFRFAAVALTAFLLLAPLVKQNVHETEKPIVIVAHDNSESITRCGDSLYYVTEYAQQMQQLQQELGKSYEVVNYTYGENVAIVDGIDSVKYDENATDISELLTEVSNRFHNRNVGALLIAGDGIYNRGINPTDALTGITAPVFTIAMGDTAERRDASIIDIRYNKVAYLGNKFPIAVRVKATHLNGERKNLTIKHKGKVLHCLTLDYNSNDFEHTETVTIDATEVGLMNIEIQLGHAENEETYRNNLSNIAVEVIDSRQKIAIIAAAPHPDISALQQSIANNSNYEVTCMLASEYPSEQEDNYDLYILHNLPSRRQPLPQSLQRKIDNTPVIAIVGTETDLQQLNKLELGLQINTRLRKYNEVTPIFNQAFSFFTLEEQVQQNIAQWPPLLSPFGVYKVSGNSQNLLTAKIGTVNSGQPLVAFVWQHETRRAFITGEGLWRWRITDYQMNGTHDNFDQMVEKMIICTSLQVNKKKFHVTAGPVYSESVNVEIGAELYNDNFEPVNSADAMLTLNSPDGTQNEYPFSRSGTGYRLNLGTLPAGTYQYSAKASLNGTNHSASGFFVVEAFNNEDLSLKANHSLLNTLSATTGGVMLHPDELPQFAELLKQRDNIKSVIYTQTRYSDLLNTPLLLIIILVLISAEWIARKYNGEL